MFIVGRVCALIFCVYESAMSSFERIWAHMYIVECIQYTYRIHWARFDFRLSVFAHMSEVILNNLILEVVESVATTHRT